MVNRPKNIGTAGETGVVRAAHRLGFPHAERVVMQGSQTTTDVKLTVGLAAGIVAQVKAGAMAHTATPTAIERWWVQAEAQRIHASAEIGLLVVARRGVSPARAEHWRCFLGLDTYIRQVTRQPAPGLEGHIVEAPLGQVLTALRLYGWGDPIIEQEESA